MGSNGVALKLIIQQIHLNSTNGKHMLWDNAYKLDLTDVVMHWGKQAQSNHKTGRNKDCGSWGCHQISWRTVENKHNLYHYNHKTGWN